MSETDDHAELETRHPLDVSIREHLARPVYKTHRELWDKANDRLLDDPGGAITAARSLLESTCKLMLGELKVAYSESSELPKLYDNACRALGMAPGGQLDPSFRAVFSSTYTVVQSVAEIRNKYGDAHGKGHVSPRPSHAEAELAVHLAGAVSCFLVRRFESHLNATRRLTRDGKAILWFDKSVVWRLVDHATNSPKSRQHYGEDVGPCLLLVGDAGVYLMSNGEPPIYHDGTLVNAEGEHRKLLLIAEAEGCDVFAEFEAWWPLHNFFNDGGDFSEPISVEEFRRALSSAHLTIVILADSENVEVMSDVEFERRPTPNT
jgi:hypothetical protein